MALDESSTAELHAEEVRGLIEKLLLNITDRNLL